MRCITTRCVRLRATEPQGRRRLRYLALPMGVIGSLAIAAAATSLATASPASVTITSQGSIARRGALVPVTATDPAGWFCQLDATGGGRTTRISRVVATPAGTFRSSWLAPRTTTIRTWTLTVVCGPTATDVRLGHSDLTAHQVREVLPPVRAFTVTPDLVDVNSNIGYQSGSIAAGTGVVFGASGLVITNNHVIDGGTSISAFDLGNGHTYRVKVLGVDVSHDLAVLQLVGAHGLRRAPFGNPSLIVRGSVVSTVGNVGGVGGTPTITSGIITALDQSIVAYDSVAGVDEHLSGLFETNALLQPGDSGGPLVDAGGGVIGIDTAAVVDADPSATTNEGFAIPINQVLATAHAILAHQVSKQLSIGAAAYTPYLGVQVIQATSGKTDIGVQVAQVEAGSPAQKAGLKPNDIITALNPHPTAKPPGAARKITTTAQLRSMVADLQPGAAIALTWRLGKSGPVRTRSLTLAKGAAR